MAKSLEVLTIESPRWNAFAEALSWAVLTQRCHHDHRHAERIMTSMGGIDIPASTSYFASRGGFCDCEILLNVAFDDVDASNGDAAYPQQIA
jgi:Protein of unknown function (DUF2695)